MSISRSIILLISTSVAFTILESAFGAEHLALTRHYIASEAFPANLIDVKEQILDEEGVTPLMRAVRDGEHDKVEALLKQGVDVNAKDSHGWTPLIYATVRGDAYNVKALIAAGADVNAKTDTDASVLTMAVRRRNETIINLLREAGAVESEGEAKTTPSTTPEVLVTKPKPLNRPMPNYTSKALDKRIEGMVSLRILIGTNGKVKKIRILTGLPYKLSYKAVEAASKLRFKPATKEGQPVAYSIPVLVEFSIAK